MTEQLLKFAGLVSQMRKAQKSYFSPSTPTHEKKEWLAKSKALEKKIDEVLKTFVTKETKEEEIYNQRLFS